MSEQQNGTAGTREIGKAMALAWADIQHAEKNATNPHFKSTYANLENVIDVVRQAYGRHGLAVIQMPGEILEGPTRVRISTTVIHSSGELLTGTMEMPVVKDKNGNITPHALGSAITYGRRYALAAVAGITQTDDDGNGDDGDAGEPDVDVAALRAQIQGATTKAALSSLKSMVEAAGDEKLVLEFVTKFKEFKGK